MERKKFTSTIQFILCERVSSRVLRSLIKLKGCSIFLASLEKPEIFGIHYVASSKDKTHLELNSASHFEQRNVFSDLHNPQFTCLIRLDYLNVLIGFNFIYYLQLLVPEKEQKIQDRSLQVKYKLPVNRNILKVTKYIVHFQKVLIYQFRLIIHQHNFSSLMYACFVLHFLITYIPK